MVVYTAITADSVGEGSFEANSCSTSASFAAIIVGRLLAERCHLEVVGSSSRAVPALILTLTLSLSVFLFIGEQVQAFLLLLLSISHLRVLRSVQDWQALDAIAVLRVVSDAWELLAIMAAISELRESMLLILGWIVQLAHLVRGILLVVMVLDSWQTDLSAALVQSHSCTIRTLRPPAIVVLSNGLEVLRALRGRVQILLPASIEALIRDRVRQLVSHLADASAVVHVGIDALGCMAARWTILTVNHEVIALGWLKLELGVGLRRL